MQLNVTPSSDDDLDERLIGALRVDGRAPMETIAAALGVSRAAVRARYQRLVERGELRVVGVVDPRVQGLDTMAHVSVFASGSVRTLAASIAALPATPLVSIVAGRASIIAEVRSSDMGGLIELVRRIQSMDGVNHVESVIYVARIKDRYSPPPLSDIPSIDETDRTILNVLQRDGRVPLAELGRMIGYSPSGAGARVRALISAGVVRVTAIASPGNRGRTRMCGLGLRVQRAEVVERLSSLPAVAYLYSAIGRWDAIATLTAGSSSEMVSEIDAIRTTPGVTSVEAWTHLEVVKEDYWLELRGGLPAPRRRR